MAKSNLFAIDLDAAERVVTEANPELLRRHAQLMAAFQRLPSSFETADNIARAKTFARQLRESASQCRATRLSDTRPLRDLLRRVDTFFKKMEKEAIDACSVVVDQLSSLGPASPTAGSPGNLGATVDQPSATVLISAESGEILGSGSLSSHPRRTTGFDWVVSGVDRDTVDLEALRPFLTEASLLHAARAHLKAEGPNALFGATYKQRASLD